MALAILVIGITIVGVILWLPLRRYGALSAIAPTLGFSFQTNDDNVWRDQFGSLPLFNRGGEWKFTHVMRGKRDGREMIVFDFQYSAWGINYADIWRYTVAAQPVDATLPAFEISSKDVWQRIHVPNSAEGQGIVLPGVFEALASSPRTYSVEWSGSWLIIHTARLKSSLSEFRALLDMAANIARHLEHNRS